MLDAFVAEVVLDSPCVLPIVGKLESPVQCSNMCGCSGTLTPAALPSRVMILANVDIVWSENSIVRCFVQPFGHNS